MKFHKINSLDELCPGYYGILEPDIHCEEWKSGEDNIDGTDLCVMPGLAFDNNFNRIGYGGGFYDRFLSYYFFIFLSIIFERYERSLLFIPIVQRSTLSTITAASDI